MRALVIDRPGILGIRLDVHRRSPGGIFLVSNNTPKRDQLLNVQGAFANELIELTNSAAKQVGFSCSNSIVSEPLNNH
jgi:hypothetical protein